MEEIIAPTIADTPRRGNEHVLDEEGPDPNTGYISEDSSDDGVVFKLRLVLKNIYTGCPRKNYF